MKQKTIEGLLKLAENEDDEMKAFLTRMAMGKPLFVAEIYEGILSNLIGFPEGLTYRQLDWDIMEHDMLLRDLDATNEVIERAREEDYIEDIQEQVEVCIKNLLEID